MSSFVKIESKIKSSTGLPLIDQVIEDVVPGTILLIKEDEFSYLHNVFLNTFVSEGRDKEDLIVIGESLANINFYRKNESRQLEQGLQKMHIAWRYSNLKLEDNDYKFDLMKKIEYQGKKLIGLSSEDILEELSKLKNHRIAIYSLYSPFYRANEIEKTLFLIKKICRQNNNICMISIPTFLHDEINFNLFFDVVISIKSNLMTGLLPNYRATIEFEKIATYKNIKVLDLDSYIYGVKFIKNKLCIENIDIPPDENDPSFSCTAF